MIHKDKGDPLMDLIYYEDSVVLFWLSSCLYLICSSYGFLELCIILIRSGEAICKQILSIPCLVIGLCGVASLARFFLLFFYEGILLNWSCFWASFVVSFINTFLHLLIYSCVLLYFLQIFLSTRDQEDKYKRIVLPTFAVVVVVVFLSLLVGRAVPCFGKTDKILGVRSTREFSVSVGILYLLYFIAGVSVFFLVRSLRNTIIVREHEYLRSRFGWALLLYLPCFLGKLAMIVLHLSVQELVLPSWVIFVQLVVVDILPTLALVASFRVQKKDELEDTLASEYKWGYGAISSRDHSIDNIDSLHNIN